MKKLLLSWVIAGAALAGMAGCAQIKKPAVQVRAVPAGVRFDQVGSVTLLIEKLCVKKLHLGWALWKFRSTTICSSRR